MCCRCYIEYLKDEELKRIYDLLNDKSDLKVEGELFPGDNVVAIANSKDMNVGVFKMKWGYSIGKRLVFNARVESLDNKELFMDGIKNRRCVIPVNNYFEWKKDNKEKYIFSDKESSILYLLGIYRFEESKPVLTILTKDSSEELSFIHDRMPVIIKKNDIKTWLDKSIDPKIVINKSIDNLKFMSCKTQ